MLAYQRRLHQDSALTSQFNAETMQRNPKVRKYNSELEVGAAPSAVISNEVQTYKDLPNLPPSNFDLLQWWRENMNKFPVLHHIAMKVLAVPASSCTSERAFSSAANTFSKKRMALSSENGAMIVFLNQNQELAFEDIISLKKKRNPSA